MRAISRSSSSFSVARISLAPARWFSAVRYFSLVWTIGCELFVLLVQRYEFPDVGDHFRIGHLLADLFVFDLQSVEA